MSDLLILGYTTRDHLLLDLDETSFCRVVSLANQIMESYPDVGHCLIVESSTPSKTSYLKYDDNGIPHERWVYQNYHVVFDAPIGYERCVAIIDTLVGLDVLPPEFKEVRMFRGDMTLRVSAKWLHHRVIPPPNVVYAMRNPRANKSYDNIGRYRRLLEIGQSISLLVHVSPPETRKTVLPLRSQPL